MCLGPPGIERVLKSSAALRSLWVCDTSIVFKTYMGTTGIIHFGHDSDWGQCYRYFYQSESKSIVKADVSWDFMLRWFV